MKAMLPILILFFATSNFAQKPAVGHPKQTKAVKSSPVVAQADDAALRAAVKAQADIVAKAFLDGDYEKVFALTHPKVQTLIGKEKFISTIREGIKADEADGFKVVAVEPSEPKEIIRVGKQLFAVVPERMRFQTPHGMFVAAPSDIAVSDDGGKTWTFIGGGAGGEVSRRKLKALFPAAADKVIIPEESTPVPDQPN